MHQLVLPKNDNFVQEIMSPSMYVALELLLEPEAEQSTRLQSD